MLEGKILNRCIEEKNQQTMQHNVSATMPNSVHVQGSSPSEMKEYLFFVAASWDDNFNLWCSRLYLDLNVVNQL